MIYPVDEENLEELIGIVKRNIPTGEVVFTLCAMRDESTEKITKDYFQLEINKLAKEYKYCPKCGCELAPIKNKEFHTYLQDNPYETIITGYSCELCDCKVDLD